MGKLLEIYCVEHSCASKLKIERSVAVQQTADQMYSLFRWTFTSSWDKDRLCGEAPYAWDGDAWCYDHIVEAEDWLAANEDT